MKNDTHKKHPHKVCFTFPRTNDAGIYRRLIENGIDVNSRDMERKTMLHAARGVSATEYLIEKGADVNAKDKEGRSPLHDAVFGNSEGIPLLLAAGADIHAVDCIGQTVLHGSPPADIARLLLNCGADPHARDTQGWTIMHCAFNVETAEVYLAAGLDINARDARGRTPLHWIAYWGSVSMVPFLIRNGADINAVDKVGRTPLHVAENVETARVLLDNGATLDFSTGCWEPALSCAEEDEMYGLVKQLMERGRSPEGKLPSGTTFLKMAQKLGSVKIIKLLADRLQVPTELENMA